MLTTDQIDALGDKAMQLITPVTDFLIEDIARRISEAGQLTATASYQVWRAQQLGLSQKEIKKRLKKLLRVSSDKLEQLLTQAAETGYNFDIRNLPTEAAIPFAENSAIQQIVSAAVQLAKDDLSNITQTIGFVTANGKAFGLTDAYNQACDLAFMKVSTGAQDYNSAIREATKNLADKGIVTINYESGVHTSLEAAVRRNVMGGLGLMQEQISKQNHDDFGCDGWEISAHAASAPDHEPIQGRQYSDAEYEKLNNSLVRRIGTLNCGHSAFPIIMGVDSPQYTPEELEEMRRDNENGVDYEGRQYTMYEATQRQRKLERAIRKQKRRILVAEQNPDDKERLQQAQIKYQVLNQEYKRFSKAAGLRLQHERMEMSGFGPKQATAAENSFKNGFTNKTSQRIIEARSEVDHVTISSIESPIEQRHTGKGNPNAILHFDVELNNRQQSVLDALPGFNSRIVVKKDSVNMADLSALTAKTGDEFALFTKSGERMVVRGNQFMVEITPEEAHAMGKEGYVWSGHTHPGVDFNVLQPSAGDYAILNQFQQDNSSIYNSAGQYLIFERTEPYV